MLAKKGKAIAGETMAKPLQHAFSSKYYHKHCVGSRKISEKKIRKQKVGAAVITTATPSTININMINDTTRHIAESSKISGENNG